MYLVPYSLFEKERVGMSLQEFYLERKRVGVPRAAVLPLPYALGIILKM